MKKYICDICGRELGGIHEFKRIGLGFSENYLLTNKNLVKMLCPDCAEFVEANLVDILKKEIAK